MSLLPPWWSKFEVLCSQFYDSDRFATAIFGFGRNFPYQRVRGQKLGETFAQRAGAVAVDYAHLLAICQGCLVEKLVDAVGGFFDGRTDYVDFVCDGACAGTRRDGDILSLRWRCGLCVGRRTLDTRDLIDGNLHAQWTRFDLRGGALHTPQDHRLGEAAHANLRTGHKSLRGEWRCGLARDAQVGLRFRKSLHHGAV